MDLNHLYAGKPSNLQWDYWLFIIFFVLFSVIAFSRVFYFHLIDERLKAYYATRYLKQLIRKELALYHPYSIITLTLFSVTVALVLLKGLQLYYPEIILQNGYYILLGLCSLGCLAWIIGRAYLLKIIQFIIGTDFGQTENRYRTIIYNQISGYVLLPLIFLSYFIHSPYDTWFFWLSISILMANYAYRIGHSVFTAVNYSAKVLHIFLYLCTLEIVPLIWLFMVLKP